MKSIIVCSNKIYYAVITKVKDSSISNKNNYYNYTHNIVPYRVIPINITGNTVHFQIGETNTFSFTVFDIRKPVHIRICKVMLLVTVHTELCQHNSFRMWSTGQTTPGAGYLEKPLGKLHSEEDWIHKKRDM